ncbi:SsrA-binding protein SmpB [candidate division WOR-3 bacterium]|nr:SsrA-binding protein SmpB [candidate division WOR-3 bacterium]
MVRPYNGRVKPVATNRKALRDYAVLERLEAGVELTGTEVKSLRAGGVSLDEGYATVEHGQVYLHGVTIAPYSHGNIFNPEPGRRRRLLLHRDEIRRLFGRVTLRGFTLIPLKLYFSQRGWAKVELGICRGKKLVDRRDDLKRRAQERDERQLASAARRTR